MQISEHLICSVNKDLECFNFSVPLSLLGRQDKSTELFVSRDIRSPLCQSREKGNDFFHPGHEQHRKVLLISFDCF